jgi:PhnB protein
MEKTPNKNKNKNVNAVPEGLHTVTPYLVVDNGHKLIDFLKNAFGGELEFITEGEDKKIMHATVKIGTSTIMISDKMEGMEQHTAMLYVYLEDMDSVFKKALQAGATSVREPKTEFYGDRAGAVKDEWGNIWWIATHVEDVSPDELEKRAEQARKEHENKTVKESEKIL